MLSIKHLASALVLLLLLLQLAWLAPASSACAAST
jgi:hypothetical protein